MDKQIKRLGIFLVICFLAVFVKLHQTQLVDVDALAAREDNARAVQRKLNLPRGRIVSADGAILAFSENVGGNMVPRKRHYPEADLFAHVTGYNSGLFLSEGVEKSYDRQLSGDTLRQQFDGLANIFANRENVGDVTLTVRKDLQELARQQLGDRAGAVTVLNPQTGEILAMWSFPSFDPNLIVDMSSTASMNAAQENWNLFVANPGNPMRSKVYRERYNPGSSFKPVTAAVGAATPVRREGGYNGPVTTGSPSYPNLRNYTPPDMRVDTIRNFGNPPSECGGNLLNSMTVSCNTSFMLMGVENGWPAMSAGASAFGYNQPVPIDLPGATQSVFPDTPEEYAQEGIAGLAQASIGQKSNFATPLQIALVSAAAANNGVIMKPHVMHNVRNQDGTIVERYSPEPWTTAMSGQAASVVREAMLGPVNNPNGSAAGTIRMPAGMVAGGKTGTAQTGGPLHVWFTGYAGPAGQTPKVVVSVVLVRRPGADDVTGGRLAAPIANVMLNKALEVVDQEVAAPVGPTTTTIPGPGAGPRTTR